jgi:hypothetical protein
MNSIALYVHERSKVSIRSTASRPGPIEICRYRQAAQQVAEPLLLEPGIYVVTSPDDLEIRVAGIDVVTMGRTGKDIPPEPNASVLALEPSASARDILNFLTVAKGLTVGELTVPGPGDGGERGGPPAR